MFSLLGKPVVQRRPPTAKGANVYGATSLGIHVSHRAFDFGDNSLLLERVERGCSVIACRFYAVRPVGCDELFSFQISRAMIYDRCALRIVRTESGYLTCLRMSNSYFRMAGTTVLA